MSVRMKWDAALANVKLQSASAAGLNAAAQRLRALSVARAPIQDGILRGSAQVSPASPGNLTAAVSYNTPYAVRQHEEVGYAHPPGGQAKYLAGPLREKEAELVEIIATATRRALGG